MNKRASSNEISSTIELEEMIFYAYHGCFKEEKVVGNRFIVNVSLQNDITKAAESDRIEDALNYTEVYNTIKEEMIIKSNLLENVAERISERLMKEFDAIEYLKLKISKMNPPMGGQMKAVSIITEKRRKKY
ncbi:dihydroneopterin aldolase [Marinilabiliaceae bacterium ANBcel2]|nr:dihydroneopterin aldolase [Marinilabiliaceae bacterium ANBcel2]